MSNQPKRTESGRHFSLRPCRWYCRKAKLKLKGKKNYSRSSVYVSSSSSVVFLYSVGVKSTRPRFLFLRLPSQPGYSIAILNYPSYSQNLHNIKNPVVLVPGLTSTVLSLPPLPTSATENPNLYIAIPLPSSPPSPVPSSPPDLPSSIDPRLEEAAALYGGIPFITRTFSHACPTRAPSDVNRMHTVLNTFFQVPVSGEEKKRRM